MVGGKEGERQFFPQCRVNGGVSIFLPPCGPGEARWAGAAMPCLTWPPRDEEGKQWLLAMMWR